MYRNHIRLSQAALRAEDLQVRGQLPNRPPSRRQFLGRAAQVGLALGAAVLLPARARAGHQVAPRPIPGTIPDTPFHHQFPGPADQPSHEPSHITDFYGTVGVLDFEGTGRGTGYDEPLPYSGDVRFQTGTYIGVDGGHHRGTFAFV